MEEENIDVKDTEKFLPIGTVVLLKGATKRLMISGYCAVDQEKKDEMWDYSGCMYPEGFLSSSQSFLFDHSQIAKIYSLGYKDSEEEEFQRKLTDYINSKKSEGDTDSDEGGEGDGSTTVVDELNNNSEKSESIQDESTEEIYNNQLLNNSNNTEESTSTIIEGNIIDEVPVVNEESTTSESPIVSEEQAPKVEQSSVEDIIKPTSEVVTEPMATDSSVVDVEPAVIPNPEPATVPINEPVIEPVTNTNIDGFTNPVVGPVVNNGTQDSNNVSSSSDSTDTGSDSSTPFNPSTTPNPNNAADLSEFDQWLNQTGPYANNDNNQQ